MKKTPTRVLLILTALALFVVPVAAIAAGGAFIDDDTSIFEGDIEWMAANGITLGCNPPTNDRYCPEDAVTRGQMAAFMKRLATGKVVDAQTAVSADTATTAADATTVGGQTVAELETHAYETTLTSNATPPASATTNILTLNLPAGTYLIQARAGINSNMASPGGSSSIVCDLTAGATQQDVRNLFLNQNGSPGETQYASWLFTHTFAAAGDAILSCDTQAGWSGNILSGATLTAISLQSSTIQAATASTTDTPDNG